MFEVSDKKIGDRGYFNRLFKQMKNGGREAMLYDLLKMKISDVDLRTVPRTKGLIDQIIYSMSDTEKFWYYRLFEGAILPGDSDWRDGEQIELVNLSIAFKNYQEQIRSKIGIDDSQLSKQLTRLCPGVKRQRTVIEGKRVTCLVFPPLDDCRQAFERQIGKEVDWED